MKKPFGGKHMASEYLYGRLPVFDGKEFDRFMKEAPEHIVKHNCVPSKTKEDDK